jgi:hypothetical protein
MTTHTALLLILLALTTSIARALHFTTLPRPDLNAIFTPKPSWTWLGGDSSASVVLPRAATTTTLWLFGDTLRGRLIHHGTQRQINSMPHSTLAFYTPSHPTPTFVFPPHDRGIFVPPPATAPSSSYYWLIDGLVGNDTGKLFLQAMVINGTVDGFVQLGSDLIVVDNPNDEVSQWRSTSLRLPNTNGTCTQNQGLAQQDGYLYLMGNCNAARACLSRVVEKEVVGVAVGGDKESGANTTLPMEYFSGFNVSNEGWTRDIDHSSSLFASPFTEGTLKHHPRIGWYVFLCQAYDAFVRLAYTGPGVGVEGPWTVTSVYEIPLRDRSNGTFSYAAKSHPEMVATSSGAQDSRQLIFSFNTNAGPGLSALVNRTWAYHPSFVQVNILL